VVWRRWLWGSAAAACLALALALVWQHVRPFVLGVRPDEPLTPVHYQAGMGYVSPRGVVAIPFDFQAAEEFDAHGWALTQRDGLWTWIDRYGHAVMPRRFERQPDDFDTHGWACVEQGGKFGWIDRQNRDVMPFRLDFAYSFGADNLAAVCLGDRWGWIDRTGKEASLGRWEGARPFNKSGLAAVQSNWKWGFIDRQGRVVMPCRWTGVGDFYAGDRTYAFAPREQDWHWIDRRGQRVDPPTADAPYFNSHGHEMFDERGPGGTTGLRDRAGKEVLAPVWEGIETRKHGYEAITGHHPLMFSPPILWLRKWLPLEKWAPFNGGLVILYDFDLRVIWRSDLHALRSLLLPVAAFFGLLAALCVWRWHAARRRR
jgi:hypothetical protein